MANKQKQKYVLVTGCAGFIGSNFVEVFKRRFPKIQVVGIDNFATGRRERVAKDITFYEGSICEPEFLERIFERHKPQYVFHFAALPRVSFSLEQPAETTRVNIYGTVLLLEKARDHKVKRFIYSSSSSLYGGAKKLPTKESENPPNPISPYAIQKYAGESFCQSFSNLFGLDTICLRYFNVFGPGQFGDSAYSTVVSAWLEGLYFPTHKDLFIEGDGSQSRDFCYVDNVVEANIKAMWAPGRLTGAAINVAHGERTNLREVKKLIEAYTGKILKLKQKPPRLGDVKHTHADISKARKLIGYQPKVKFAKGLERTVAWFEGRLKS